MTFSGVSDLSAAAHGESMKAAAVFSSVGQKKDSASTDICMVLKCLRKLWMGGGGLGWLGVLHSHE